MIYWNNISKQFSLSDDEYEMKPSKEHYEKAFKIIEWSILVILILASLVYVKDVWIKYQSNDTSRKVSRKVSQFLDNPAITLW